MFLTIRLNTLISLQCYNINKNSYEVMGHICKISRLFSQSSSFFEPAPPHFFSLLGNGKPVTDSNFDFQADNIKLVPFLAILKAPHKFHSQLKAHANTAWKANLLEKVD